MNTHEKTKRDLMRMSAATALLGVVGFVVFAFGQAKAMQSTPTPGNIAPAFSGITSQGETITLDQFANKTVILEWTNHGCPYVKKHYESGNMQATQKLVSQDDDIVWISVISSAPGKQGHVSPEEANQLTASRGAVPDYVVLDASGDIGRAYQAKTTPHMYVIDGNQTVQYNGAIDDKPSANPKSLEGATNYTLAALNALDTGQTPDPAQTKPYGCSVKYGP